MAEVQIDRRHVCCRRIEGKFRIEPITRLEYELLPRLYTGDWLDRIMNPVEAVWIIFAVLARLLQGPRGLDPDAACYRQPQSPRPDKAKSNYRHSPNRFRFHWKSPSK